MNSLNPLAERVQRERDRAADKFDPMLREISNPREQSKGATEAWERRRRARLLNEDEELRELFISHK